MSWSFPIVRVFGTQIRIHLTFFLILLWVGILAFRTGGWPGALIGLAFILALFACVILHEFGHALAARAFGIKTPDITLLPIGGVARLERMPREPVKELVVAIAGPLVNVAIAIILVAVLGLSGSFAGTAQQVEMHPKSLSGFLASLATINIWLVVFNLIPAFPMDGGRVFRALLAMFLPYSRATSVAAATGQALAFAGVFAGFMIPAPLLIFVALFIFLGAGVEAANARLEDATADLSLKEAMMEDFITMGQNELVRHGVDHLLAGTQTDFPVLNGDGAFVGMVTRQNLIVALRQHGEDAPISRAISECEHLISENASLAESMRTLRNSRVQTLPIVTDNSVVIGLLSLENIGELIMVKGALEENERSERNSVSPGTIETGKTLVNESAN